MKTLHGARVAYVVGASKNAKNTQKTRVERKRLRSIVKVFADCQGVDIYFDSPDVAIVSPVDGVVEYPEGGE